MYTFVVQDTDRRLYTCAVADINITVDADDPEEYQAMVSDAENDDGCSDGADSALGDETEGGDEDELEEDDEDPAEALFDDDLLTAVGGMASITSGTISADILKDMASKGWSNPVSYSPFPYLDQPYEPRTANMQEDYPQLFREHYGPTPRSLEAATTVSGVLFYFMQPRLWEDIAEASNEYFDEKIDERVEGQYTKQEQREKKIPGFKKSTRDAIKAALLSTPPITARELCVFVGLLFARTIAPNKEKLENHWKTTDEGGIPRGRFGIFMSRDRFMHISRNLHFSSNNDPRAATDRAWKLRPVVDALQQQFKAGYIPPPVMAFDEAMLPSRSTFNRMRVYMKDKPHKWGTKLFMLCCSTSAYCLR